MGNKRKFKSGKFKSGTWIERDLFLSRAYLSLTGFAPQLLVLFLAKRDINSNKECSNINNLTMTYLELENIFNRGKQHQGLPIDGISRPRIIRAIDDLLAKGFIKRIKRGGICQHDKAVYGLTEEWRIWRKGIVFRTHEKDYRVPSSFKCNERNRNPKAGK